jgi:hypothetical protein
MRSWKRWLFLFSGLAAAFVAVAVAAQAIRQNSWSPVVDMGWLPAVIVACWPGYRRGRCWPRRRNSVG